MKDDIAIKVENISKVYRLGKKEKGDETLFGLLLSSFTSIKRNLSNIKSLTNIDKNESRENIIWALKNISFSIKKGEAIGIIGPNGAGKSTILKILSKITTPTSGNFKINGRVSSLLEVGTGFHPDLTGKENIYLNGTILGMKKAEIDLLYEEIVEFSEVRRFINTPVKRYSSGMKLRLAFSVAAHLVADIMIIDEVLAVGDMAFQKKCMSKMSDVANIDKTILFVSHRLNVLRNICPKSILIIDGQIKGFGNTEEIIDMYSNFIFNKGNDRGILLKNLIRRGNKDLEIIEFYSISKGVKCFSDFSVKRNEKIDFIFKIKINKNYNDFSVRLGLRSPNSHEILYFTDENQVSLASISGGSFKLSLSIDPTFLIPNRYPLYIILKTQNVGADIIDDPILTLKILNDGTIKNTSSGANLAYLTSKSKCKILS